jgi:hypothetical protein
MTLTEIKGKSLKIDAQLGDMGIKSRESKTWPPNERTNHEQRGNGLGLRNRSGNKIYIVLLVS